jgi:hypothetical protein
MCSLSLALFLHFGTIWGPAIWPILQTKKKMARKTITSSSAAITKRARDGVMWGHIGGVVRISNFGQFEGENGLFFVG